MKIHTPQHTQDELRAYVRQWVPISPGAEMVCSALKVDINVCCRVATDERGIAGAISFTRYKDRLHVFSLGSLRKGAGSELMSHVEAIAAKAKLPVTVSATISSEGFYAQRGYKRKRGVVHKSIVEMKRK